MHKVLILDFGSQYTQLIARRVREIGVYCEIWSCLTPLQQIIDYAPQALVLSGGPASVLKRGSPRIDARLLDGRYPVLGICYGMQLMTHLCGGRLHASQEREYGGARVRLHDNRGLFEGLGSQTSVWMSHGDSIQSLPEGFVQTATTEDGVVAAMAHATLPLVAVQFHPEVHHTDEGRVMLKNFLLGQAKLVADWNMQDFIADQITRIRAQVGRQKVILGLSGGVDSAVAAVLIHQAIGNQLTCIFVDNGLLRLHEAQAVKQVFSRHFHIKLKTIQAGKTFLRALRGVKDPERKRKIIGKIFIDVFMRESKKIKGAAFLAQGTLYPDVIESVSFKGPSAVIKSHHNVGGLPQKMGLKLVEPLRELFKDEVRELGRQLGLPEEIIGRHPFPGPGLGIRYLGAIHEPSLDLLRRADAILIQELKATGWYNKVWQAFVVLLPVRSVGVMGDERTYELTACVRIVESVDGMTADWAELPKEVLARISNRIINEVRGINRVVYDISSKPPATIEWE